MALYVPLSLTRIWELQLRLSAGTMPAVERKSLGSCYGDVGPAVVVGVANF